MGQLIRDREAAYLAGHLDGDGTVLFEKRGTNTVVRVQWISTHRPSLAHVQSLLDGKGYWKQVGGSRTDIGCLCLYSKADCLAVLKRIAPYTVVKYNKAYEAIFTLGQTMEKQCNPIDWDYLAGFTDTDGHVTQSRRWKNGGLSYKLGWTQKGDCTVLAEIQEFLAENGITAHLYHIHSGVFQLMAMRQREVAEILQSMYPYLFTKSVKAKETMNYLSRKGT